MELQELITPHMNVATTWIKDYKRSNQVLFFIIVVAACCASLLLVLAGVAIGFGLLFGLLAVLAILALIAWQPVVGCYVVLASVVLIEAEPLTTSDLTDHLPVFYWPPALAGLIERPIGFLLIFVFLVFICRRLLNRERPLIGGALFVPLILFLLFVAISAVHGLMSGGNLQEIVGEIRPLWYLFLSYLLATNLITQKRHVRIMIWIVILGAFVKAIQGVYIYLIAFHGDLSGHHTIMSHEDSFFFVGLLLLLMLLCLHYRYLPQLWATLLCTPFVLIALVGNQRRADYVALLLAMVVVWAIIFCTNPKARRWLIIGSCVCVGLGGGYILGFSQSSSVFASPARGIVSVFRPSSTDVVSTDSNLYRTIENNDLLFTVKQDPLLGFGLGKPFLQPVPLTSIYPEVEQDDPVYNYVPHNNIYWIWMRLGSIGFLVFWYLIGSIIIRGCLIARNLKDSYLQLTAIYIIAMVFVEITVAYADYQLYFFRNIIYIGLLIGILMRLPIIDSERKALATS